MNAKLQLITLALFGCLFFQQLHAIASDETEIARATAAINAATPRAQSDPSHPIFHLTPPANWMNDPNGPIFYHGYYHLFYQLNPFSDGDGPKYWGHVRSRDLAHWEPLPIALHPSTDHGESGVWSGCCTINGLGEPMIFYTSVAPDKSPGTHSEQWAAIGDKDLIHWQKLPTNPVLSESLHNGTKIYDWRDPFIFHEGRRTFMVLGGNLNEAKGGQAVVNLYEAQNPEFTDWRYRGVLFQLPDSDARTAECPNFFKLDGRWVLFVSPYNRPEYYIGDFDPDSGHFQAHSRGTLDADGHFYAPNTMQLSDGKRIVWGWINGFPAGHGWNGCLSLPRILSITRDGQLHQEPVSQLEKLRGPRVTWRNETRSDITPKIFPLPQTNALEIIADLDLKTGASAKLTIADESNPASAITMSLTDSTFKLMDTESPLPPSGKKTEKDRNIRLHIFMDHSILEAFVNEDLCITKLIPPPTGPQTLKITSDSGPLKLHHFEAWPMKTIWE